MTGILGVLAGGGGRPPLAVSANNVTATDSGVGSEGLVTTTQSPNTTITGGLAPYTQLWTLIEELSAPTPDISGATALNPTWSATVGSTSSVSTWLVTVTDSAMDTATADITVTLNWIGF